MTVRIYHVRDPHGVAGEWPLRTDPARNEFLLKRNRITALKAYRHADAEAIHGDVTVVPSIDVELAASSPREQRSRISICSVLKRSTVLVETRKGFVSLHGSHRRTV